MIKQARSKVSFYIFPPSWLFPVPPPSKKRSASICQRRVRWIDVQYTCTRKTIDIKVMFCQRLERLRFFVTFSFCRRSHSSVWTDVERRWTRPLYLSFCICICILTCICICIFTCICLYICIFKLTQVCGQMWPGAEQVPCASFSLLVLL